ncbi:MAG: hypothetical protein DI530_15005 [Sphingomonas sp.]|uniref:hypothetical protein n=1 Tax=Sphingomonas sp. TaxID=28214 RepID=UPI000DBC1DCA|nr:hypothetical protein [Sphingomonas sp.]PZU75561.1 MAG: hypothetical protein DI530_15005 [Sphingomonas sp.]
MDYLGLTLRDRITGFEGICTGHTVYISGCSQLLLVPPLDGTTYREPQWFDEQRCEVTSHGNRVVLDNGATPGCDRAAPKR